MKYFTFSKPGRAWNEDRCFVSEKFAFVLDGATSIYNQKYSNFHTDAEWLSNWWYEFLKIELFDEKKTVLEILEKGMELCSDEYKKMLGENVDLDCPSSTLSIVREYQGKLEIFSVADSPIVLQGKSGLAIKIFDNRCDMLDDINKLIIKNYAIKENISVMKAKSLHSECIADGRKTKNKIHGYYVLDTSNSKEMLDNAIYKIVDKDLIKKVLITSDGYSQIYDLFEKYSIEEFANKINSIEDAESMYNELCELQDRDIDGNTYVRFKIRDDASIAVLDFD